MRKSSSDLAELFKKKNIGKIDTAPATTAAATTTTDVIPFSQSVDNIFSIGSHVQPLFNTIQGVGETLGVNISGVPGYFTQFLSNITKVKAALIIVVVFTVITLMFAYFLLPNHTKLIAVLAPTPSSLIQDETMAFTSVFAGSIFSAIFLCFCIIRLYGKNKIMWSLAIAYCLFCILQIIGLFRIYKTAKTTDNLNVYNYLLLVSQIANGLLLIVAAFLAFQSVIGRFVGISISILVAAPSLHNPSSLVHAKNNKTASDSVVDNYLQNR